MPFARATKCHMCNGPLVSVTRPTIMQINDEFVSADRTFDACPAKCEDYLGGPVEKFDPSSDDANVKAMNDAWIAKYGHLPPPPTGTAASVVVPIRLSMALAERLDRARGKRSRSSFLRAFLTEALP